MAKVYLVRDLILDRDVALKVLREQFADDEQFVERFRQEAHNAASLSHPNVVHVYDRGRSESGEYYITMEYVPGGTLKDLILKHGALAPEEAACIAAEIADALSAAHESGVVHRDIKPQNVLLTGPFGENGGIVKVADFGIARAASSVVTAASVILGTAGYMSPEQAASEPATPRSDLYSLGIVLYEMLTGGMPFEAESPFALAMKHLTEPPLPPKEVNPAVPDDLNDVVAKLLAKKPEDRYANAAEVAEDLRRTQRGEVPIARGAADRESRVAREEPTMALRSDDGERLVGARRLRRRRKRTAMAVLVASVALVALLGAIAWAVSSSLLEGRNTTAGALLEEARLALGGNVEVPDVVGLDRAEAQTQLVGEGFEVEIQRSESRRTDVGKVIGQSPTGGEEADEGSVVTLFVGDGPDAVPVPDLTGLTLDEARDLLDEADLVLGNVNEVPSDDVPRGEVVRQSPSTGEELEQDSPVDITLSSGPEEEPAAPEPAPAASPDPPQYDTGTSYDAAPSSPAPAPAPAPTPEATPSPAPAPEPTPEPEPPPEEPPPEEPPPEEPPPEEPPPEEPPPEEPPPEEPPPEEPPPVEPPSTVAPPSTQQETTAPTVLRL